MIPSKPKNLWLEIGLLFLLATFWGSSYLFIRVAVESIPPVTLIAMRVAIAGVLLVTVVFIQGHKFPREPKMWFALCVQSTVNAFGAWTVLAWGQQFIDSGLAAVLNSTTPIFVFLITFFVTKHEQLNWYKFAGVLLGVSGVCLIVGVNVLNGLGQQLLGQLAALLGAFFYAIGAIYGKKFKSLKPVVTTSCIMLISSAVLIPASFIIDDPLTLQPTANAWVSVVLLSVFSTALAFLIFFRLIHTLGSLGTTSQGFMRCGIAIMLGVVVLNEVVTPTLAVGLAISVLGVALINLPIQNILNYIRKRVN